MPDAIPDQTAPPDDIAGDNPPWDEDPRDTPSAGASAGETAAAGRKAINSSGKTEKPAGQPPLDDEELTRFKELDQIVYQRSIGYLVVADALKEISSRKLYRMQFKSFDDYCLSRHGFGRQQGAGLVEAANLVERIKPHLEEKAVLAPVTEGVLRELRRIKDDEQCARAYVEAVHKAGGDELVTPRDVRAVAKSVALSAQDHEAAAARPAAKKDLAREHLTQLRQALKAGKPAEELEPLLEALVRSLGL